MKATGIVRKVDDLGRIVLPKELRETMDIDIECPLEIYVEDEKVILKKYEPPCVFCGSTEEKVEYEGRLICHSCVEELSEQKD